MEDYRVFHNLLLETVVGDDHNSSLIDVGIVYHDPSPGTKSKGVHISRIQCRPNIRIAALTKSYNQRYPGLGDAVLYQDDRPIPTEAKVKGLGPQNARFVALQALPTSWATASSQQQTSSALLEARVSCLHLAPADTKIQVQSAVNLSASIAQTIAFIANVNEVCDNRSADELETCALKTTELLQSIGGILRKHSCPDTTRKLKDIDALLRQFRQPATTIAVVGATGEGKSSLINALLDLLCLIPTGCTSACTSVATEIAYNWTDSAYRAEIRFMQKAAWRQMLERLLDDIHDEEGNIPRNLNEDGSESAIALAQLVTVYPDLDVQHLERVSVEELMSSTRLRHLGTFIPLKHDDPNSFAKELRQYLSGDSGLWPLIASVKVFVKAPVLATGAVLVDLPGVMDTNQARSRISKRYMQDCDHIFVVSPMKRAVDDSVAHDLVSMAPKEQVQLDGLYGNATFIGIFADDAKPREVSQAYHLQKAFQPLFDELSAVRKDRDSLEDRVKKSESKRASLVQKLTVLEKRRKELSDQREKCRNGEVIFAQKSTKRKSQVQPETPPKKLKAARTQASPGTPTSNHVPSGAETDTSPRRQLTESDITKMIEKADTEYTKISLSVNQASSEYGKLQGELESLREKQLQVESRIRSLAIARRNKYTSTRIRDDFERGYRGLVQAWESEQSAADRARNTRDIEDVRRRLSVFMVSSAAYQAIQGRHEDEDCSKGFTDPEDTEIPQLQEHCRRLTDEPRTKAYRRLLTDALQLLASLQLWASEVEIREHGLSNFEQRQERKSRKAEQQQLKSDLDALADRVIRDIRYDIRHRLYTAFDQAVMVGRQQAGYSAIGWGLKQTQGGLHYMTYRAVLKHQGVFTSSRSIEHDFNKQLGADFKRRITREWELFFTRLMPDTVNKLHINRSKVLDDFFNAFCERNKNVKTPLREIEDLRRQLPNYKQDLVSMANEIVDDVQRHQRQINRQGIEPVIQRLMMPVYQDWHTFSGRGMISRMRNAVERHVTAIVAQQDPNATGVVPGVFEDCRDTLKHRIDDMVHRMIKVKSMDAMKDAIDAICKSCNDLGMGPGATVDAESMDPRLKAVHKELRGTLGGANSLLLKAVLGKQVLDDDDAPANVEAATHVAPQNDIQDGGDKGYIVIDSEDEMDIDG